MQNEIFSKDVSGAAGCIWQPETHLAEELTVEVGSAQYK
jgi:hypothetical protein